MNAKSIPMEKCNNLLIVVHPGSMCGSADFNFGDKEASLAREAVMVDLITHVGDVIVLDGNLSDELTHFEDLNFAINYAVRSANEYGIGKRLRAEDPEHSSICIKYLTQLKYPLNAKVKVTGAWYYPSENSGCVFSTYAALVDAGYANAVISDFSMSDESNYLEREIEPLLNLIALIKNRPNSNDSSMKAAEACLDTAVKNKCMHKYLQKPSRGKTLR